MTNQMQIGRKKGRFVWRITRALLAIIVVGVTLLCGFLYWQAAKVPDRSGEYVALGSSFAAGMGLGPRVDGSPVQCFRTSGGYPTRVAQQMGLRLVDMTCSGSTLDHILSGGQLLLGPQLAAVGPETKLVTITSGGNDIGYVGDLMAASGNMGRLGAYWHGAIKPPEDRSYDAVRNGFERIITKIQRQAPMARIFIVNYPTIVPASGNCTALGVDNKQADISREVARRLVIATQQAATKAGVQLIDMASFSAGNDVCSDAPWVNGALATSGTAFHPNAAGASATADSVVSAIRLGTTPLLE